MQSSTALVKSFGPPKRWGQETDGLFAALQFVSRKLDLGIVDGVDESYDVAGEDVHRLMGDGAVPVDVTSGPLVSYLPPQRRLLPGAAGNPWSVLKAGEAIAEGAGLVHDAGNLLGALSLYAELLAAPGVLHEEYREYADDLRLLSERSSAMMMRLLSQTQKQKRYDANEVLTVLPDVIARCGGLLTRIAGRLVEVQLGHGCHTPVRVSGDIVERIVTNLVKNAGEAMDKETGTIVICVEQAREYSGARLVLTVSDTGRGMTRAQMGSLGEAEPRANGRGLGFRVVRELAALSDATLGIESEPGEGTSVSVAWRAVEQAEVEVHGTALRVTRAAAGWIAC